MWLLKQGYNESTIGNRMDQLNTLIRRGVNILDPEEIKEAIPRQPWCEQRKGVFVDVYTVFLEMLGKTWIPPLYDTRTKKIPYVPIEADIDQIIAGCRRRLGTFTQLIKETGMRSGEAWALNWIDFNSKRRVVAVNNPEKGSNPRMLPISKQLCRRIEMLPKNGPQIFRKGRSLLRHWTSHYWQIRQNLSKKLDNPRLLKVTWKSIRHWKGTMEYHKTKDILHVKETLGHKSIQNTLIYIHLENALFQNVNDEFHVRIAKTPEEVTQLLEVGFEYVTDMDGLKFFRKRK